LVIVLEPELSALFEVDAETDHAEAIELRVLAGEQAGARVFLAPGDYLLGSGDECSLVLRGPGIAKRHALLRFDGGEASIEPVEGTVRNVQGDDISGNQSIAHGLPVDIGGVWISVDNEDAPWPDSATDFRASAAAENEAMEALAEANAAVPVDVDFQGNAADDPSGSESSATRRVAVLLGLLLTLVLLGFLGWRWWAEQVAASKPTQVAAPVAPRPQQVPEELRRIVADFQQDGRLELKRVGKQWVVSGYLPDAERKRMLVEQLASGVSEEVRTEVWVDAQLLDAARRVLAENMAQGGASLRMDSVATGVATLSGAVSSAERLESVRAALIAGVPGIIRVESRALLPDALLKQLKERIAAAGLSSRLAVLSDAPEVKLGGRLYPDEIAKWENLFVEFSREYGDVLPIRATVTRVVPKPPVGVQTIVGGAVPYIVTDSGQFVNQGGDVQGHTLTAIRDGEVVFEGSKRIKLAR
jgi:type III secretion system YscD/HrpQ family protein